MALQSWFGFAGELLSRASVLLSGCHKTGQMAVIRIIRTTPAVAEILDALTMPTVCIYSTAITHLTTPLYVTPTHTLTQALQQDAVAGWPRLPIRRNHSSAGLPVVDHPHNTSTPSCVPCGCLQSCSCSCGQTHSALKQPCAGSL